jgi:hypothetical protein
MVGTTDTTQIGDIVTIDIADTVGQSSAIEANGSPIFRVQVTWPAQTMTESNGSVVQLLGFGRVLDELSPVRGHEVGFTAHGVIA